MKRTIIFALMIVFAGCSSEPAKPVVNKEADLAAVNKLRDDFIAAFNANDAVKIGDVYTADAVAMPGDQPSAHGRQAIVDMNKAVFQQAAAKIALTPEQTEVFGDNGFDRGTYSITVTPKAAGSKPIVNKGRYIVLLQRETGGAWKVTNDIDNRSEPAAPPPPAAKAKAPAPAPASKAKPKKK